MGKINILDEKVSSRIAAGEVIERPSSVVKELVENSIDAKASSIAIYIEEGGVKTIRVTDNGEGMDKEDVATSILKHSTSKIYSLNDLNNIHTMGFRGEALASIAAVSILTIRTKTASSELGSELVSRGGSSVTVKEVGIPEGTSITVNNLFYNTPARLKFLKKTSTELGYIVDMVSRLILSHPEISFRLSTPEKTIYHSPGNGKLEDAIYSIYGTNVRSFLVPVDYKFNSIYVKGYIGSPSFTFKTTKHQTLFVNGRYVRDEMISKAILNAYGERLMKNSYPFFVLSLSLNPSDLDVNIHPNKLAIHFRDDNEVEYVIMNAVDTALGKNAHAPYLNIQSTRPVETAPADKYPKAVQNTNYTNEKNYSENEKLKTLVTLSSEVSESVLTSADPKDLDEHGREERKDSSLFTVKPERKAAEAEQPLIEAFAEKLQYQIVGVAFDTYIIIQTGERLYLIDQHAAHERKIYDILMEGITRRSVSQQLLIPFRYSINFQEKNLLEENLDVISDMGFTFSQISDTYCELSAYPQILGEIDIYQTLQDLIESLDDRKTSIEIRKDKIAKGACKRAIKGGMKMNDADIRNLLDTILSTDTIPHCPHGRPLAIQITRKDLEVSFGREV